MSCEESSQTFVSNSLVLQKDKDSQEPFSPLKSKMLTGRYPKSRNTLNLLHAFLKLERHLLDLASSVL